MVDFGASALKLGQVVAKSIFSMWFNRHKERGERSRELIQIAAGSMAPPLQEAKLKHLVDGVANQVAEQIEPLLTREFSELPQFEITAALEGAADALSKVDVCDDDILLANANPDELARLIRERAPQHKKSLELSRPAQDLYDLALDQSCRYLARILTQLPAFQGRALAETLTRLASQTADLTEILARTPRSNLDAPRGTQHDTEFEREYLGNIQATLDRLDLLGLSMRNRPQLSLATAYLSLRSSRPVGRNLVKIGRSTYAGGAKSTWFASDGIALSSDDRTEATLGGSYRTLIRGEAGSGKTTLLNWVGVNCATTGFSGAMKEWNNLVPFPIRLRSFAQSELPRPEEFVAHTAPSLAGLMPEGWVHRVLRSGRAALLIDGVDEVPRRRRGVIKAWLSELLASFPKIRTVVTARPAAADEDWLGEEQFASTDLEQMSPSDVRAFLKRWHDAAASSPTLPCEPAEIPRAEGRLLAQLDNRLHLRSLATNPLLCAMLCALNLTSVAELPQSRMELYRAALDMLLDLRDAEKQIPSVLSSVNKIVLLRDLAWRLTQNNRIELSREDVFEFISRKLSSMPNVDESAEEIVEHLLERSGVIREPIPGRVDFVHRTFQEYLAASEATEQKHLGVLIEHAHLDQWRETIVMACGHAKRPQVEEILSSILDRAERETRNSRRLRVLAAACLETTSDVPAPVRQRVEDCIAQYLVPPRSINETQSLSSIGHRLLRHLPARLEGLSEAAAAATARAAALTGDASALARLREYANDGRRKVQTEVIDGWQYFDPQRYAEEVLSSAPLLPGGRVRISSDRLIPHLGLLKNLMQVDLSITGQSDYGILSDVPFLHKLTITGAPVDITKIPSGLPATSLWIFAYGGLDRLALQALSKFSKLSDLVISDRELSSIDGVESVPELESFGIYNAKPDLNISALKAFSNLRKLTANGVIVTSAVLERLNNLTDLRVTDAEWLTSTGSILGARPGLISLMTDRSRCADLSGVAGSELEWLSVSDCPIENISALAHADKLQTVYIDGCPVEDISPLAGKQLTVWVSPKRSYNGMATLDHRTRVKLWK